MRITDSGPVLGLALLAMATPLTSQSPTLVKDIRTDPFPASSRPTGFAVVNGVTYFAAGNAVEGRELWATTGTSAWLVEDIAPGAASSNPSSLVSFQGDLYFQATTPGDGAELWRSDGTAAGTELFADLYPGVRSSEPKGMVVAGGVLYFTANDGVAGAELWRSDGTIGGTVRVADIQPGPSPSRPSSLTAAGSSVFFAADDGTTGTEIWISDGSAAGTVRLGDLWNGPGSSSPVFLTAIDDELLFYADDGINGYEMWRSDGTPSGTQLVVDLYPGSLSSVATSYYGTTFRDPYLTRFGGRVFFTADDNVVGDELRVLDLATNTVSLVHDLRPGSFGSFPSSMTVLGSELYFAAQDEVLGQELWKTDGTSGGTTLVAEIAPGLNSAFIDDVVAIGGSLYFAADDGSTGIELWQSDGTTAGTSLLAELTPGAGGSNIQGIVACPHGLIFEASVGSTGREPWVSDLTTSGTTILRNINVEPVEPTRSAAPDSLADIYGTCVFAADDGSTGSELWRSDGTTGGTFQIGDFTPGLRPSIPDPRTGALMHTHLYFQSRLTTLGLWKSDGTSAGTELVRAFRWPPSRIVALGDQLFLNPDDGVVGYELWRSDGTTSGTTLLKDLNPGSPNGSPVFSAFGDRLMIAGDDPTAGRELWLSDGTTAGTNLLADINPGGGDSDPLIGAAHRRLGLMMFSAKDGTTGRELWASDGTASGTIRVSDLASGDSMSNTYAPIVEVGDHVVFRQNPPFVSGNLWSWDGTNPPVALANLAFDDVFLSGTGFPDVAVLRNEVMVFGSGNSLWRTDGTPTGTFAIGSMPGKPEHFESFGGNVAYFVAGPFTSRQIWSTDGSASGTQLLANGFASSNTYLTLSSGRLLLAVDDPATGRELFSFHPGATAQGIGVGCGANWPYPSLHSDPPVLGTSVTVSGEFAESGSAVALLLGGATPPIALSSGTDACFFYLDPGTLAVLHTEVTTTGDWSTTIPLPISPALVDLRAGLQAIAGPTASPVGADLSNSMVWTFGQ